jgi:proliferating cell nuclear antigen
MASSPEIKRQRTASSSSSSSSSSKASKTSKASKASSSSKTRPIPVQKKERNHNVRITTSDAILFKKLFPLIAQLVAEINIEVTSFGLNIQAMDSGHVSLIIVSLAAAGFKEFSCQVPMVLGIQLEQLNKLFSAAKFNDECELICYENSDMLNLNCRNLVAKRELEGEIHLIDIEAEKMGIPKTNYDYVIDMSSRTFYDDCTSLTKFDADIVTITVSKNVVSFSIKTASASIGFSYWTDSTDQEKEEEQKEEVDRCINITTGPNAVENLSMRFALKYLKIFSSAHSLSDRVQLSLSPGIPISVLFCIPDVGKYRYYLAPKIDDNDTDD